MNEAYVTYLVFGREMHTLFSSAASIFNHKMIFFLIKKDFIIFLKYNFQNIAILKYFCFCYKFLFCFSNENEFDKYSDKNQQLHRFFILQDGRIN